jgi:hypothetical protein
LAGAVAAFSIVACAIFVAVNNQHGSDNAASDDDSNASAQSPDPTADCVASWNTSNTNKASVAAIDTAAQSGADPTAYVNVGFSTLFPDRCLITIANPSTMYAQQYLQDTGGRWSALPSWTGTANQLDASNTSWNARMHNNGIILLQ